MADLDISPQSLRTSAGSLSEVIERMASAISALEGELRGYGFPWGTGVVGDLIGQLYEGVHDAMFEHFEENVEIVSEFAEGLDNTAATLDEVEGANEDDMREVSTALGGMWSGPGTPP